ncbi:MAG: hypothetical protein WBN18_00205 [Flavobacteriaceae bacterium]
MKAKKVLLFVSIIICSVYEMYAQPGEESDKKYNIHEIKLYEREDGSKAGAMAWFTASPDSIQKFVIRNLNIMEPVQVLLQTLSPNDEVTMQFIKEKWSEPESSISAKGKTIGKKIFRTHKTAAMGIKAKKAGIPYVILIQVGKKLPVNSTPLIKITNDKNEYEAYLKNKGKTKVNTTDTEAAVIPVANTKSGGGNGPNNSSLLYIIIGLLALMVALLGYFVFVRKDNKKVLMVTILLGLGLNPCWSQTGGPIPLNVENTGDGSSYTDAGITGMVNQGLIVDLYKRLSEQAAKLADLDDSYDYLNEQLNRIDESVVEGLAELSETDSYLDEAYYELKNEFEAFKNNFADNMPGEDTEGGTRTIPPGGSEMNLNQIRAKIRELEAQVAFLSDRDRNYAPEDNRENILIYCEDVRDCAMCLGEMAGGVIDAEEQLRELNRIIKYSEWITETGIASGNALANSAPGMGLGWQKQLVRIQKSRKSLWEQYHNKYEELVTKLDKAIDDLKGCNRDYNDEGPSYLSIDALKESALRNNPQIATPLF